MWSGIAKLIELLLQRSRLRVRLDWIVAEGEHAYAADSRALLISIINPVGHDIPVDAIRLDCGCATVELADFLCSTCPSTDIVIPARDRCKYWIGQVQLGQALLQEGIGGRHPLQVEVQHATGRQSMSNRISIDLEVLRLWLWAHRSSVSEAERQKGGSRGFTPLLTRAIKSGEMQAVTRK